MSKSASKPVLFVTGHVPPDRVELFRRLSDQVAVEFALFGGRSHHATETSAELPFPHHHCTQRAISKLVSSGNYDAVIAGTTGRIALPAAYFAARRQRLPFLLWTALWAQPKSLAGVFGYPILRHIYKHAAAVITYGPHVSAYVRARGARNIHIAPQAVDANFWRFSPSLAQKTAPFTLAYIGRLEPEKGLTTLLEAWRLAELPTTARLEIIGTGSMANRLAAAGPDASISYCGAQSPAQVRDSIGRATAIVLASRPTKTFLEPWGLVVNEAMQMGKTVITTDATGAAAGGLVIHGRNGLITGANDPAGLARAITRLNSEPALSDRLATQAKFDIAAYTAASWVDGFKQALRSVG